MAYTPKGARVLVEDIITSLSLEERAQRAGLEIVVENENRPLPTMGKVVALGSDPMVHEDYKEGDVVFFDKHAGREVILKGKSFRSLEIQEIIGCEREGE